MELIWAMLKLVFVIFVWIILGIVHLVEWIIRSIREARIEGLRHEVEEANSTHNTAEVNSEEFVSGIPDSVESQIDENEQLPEENIVEPSNEKIVTQNQKEIIKAPKHSRWELIQPEKKEDKKDDKEGGTKNC